MEQHSAPVPQAFPSVVQVALFAGTEIAWHWPLAQIPEQHWEAPLHPWPVDRHAPLAHAPPTQLRLQHSASPVQLAPAALQNCDELHWPVAGSHAVEQQSAFPVQLSPPGLQACCTGVAHAPASQRPEQHSLAPEHRAAPGRH